MMVFMEYIRKKLGWCPNADAVRPVRRQYPAPDGEIGIGAVAGGSREAMEGVFVDYTSPRFLPVSILVFGGLFVAGFLIPSLRSVFFILTGLSFIAYAAAHLYLDTKRAEIKSFGDAVIVQRSRSRPLIFGKDAFRSVAVKGPYPPGLRWMFALLLILLVAGVYLARVWVGWMRYSGSLSVDPDLIIHTFFEISVAVFMLELLYRFLVGLRYPGHVRVTLKPAGFLRVYTDDPEEGCGAAGGFRMMVLHDKTGKNSVNIPDPKLAGTKGVNPRLSTDVTRAATGNDPRVSVKS